MDDDVIEAGAELHRLGLKARRFIWCFFGSAGVLLVLLIAGAVTAPSNRVMLDTTYLVRLGAPDRVGCCRVETVVEYDPKRWSVLRSAQHEAYFEGIEWVAVWVRHSEFKWQYGENTGPFTVTLGRSHWLNVSFQHFVPNSACRTMPRICAEEAVRQALGDIDPTMTDLYDGFFAQIQPQGGSHRHDVFRPVLFSISILTSSFVIIPVAALYFYGLFVARNLLRWRILFKGSRRCPKCRYELLRHDDGMLSCSECGLKCRLGGADG
ncbi:MAG: hypothetical protein EA380_08805 [Phycisphaeraceae bacterium]|nr:MAG: hypothetical protein EA380_08805 [Phycisphaeraceae bacterium]